MLRSAGAARGAAEPRRGRGQWLAGAAAAAAAALRAREARPRFPFDPLVIPKFQHALVVPPAMPPKGKVGNVTEYEIAARQIQQQILPARTAEDHRVRVPAKQDDAATFHSPAFSIEARRDEPVRVKWINGLVAANGGFLPHLLTVDPTLHWANPPGPPDSEGSAATPYAGPVPDRDPPARRSYALDQRWAPGSLVATQRQ